MESLKSAGQLLVHLPKSTKDEVELSNGKTLYLDGRYNNFENRISKGVVHSVPSKWSDIFHEGDTVYFHHSISIGKNRVEVGLNSKLFILQYTKEHSYDCLVYLIERDNEIFTVNDFIFVEPTEAETYKQIGSILVPSNAENKKPWRGKVAYLNDYVREQLNIEVGDEVVWSKDSEYEMEVEGKILYRMRVNDIMAIYEKD